MDPPQRHRRFGRNLLLAMVASVAILVVEVWGAVVTGSLALLADAGHVLTDISGLLLAYLALRFASRPATPQASYGYYRAEVLAAMLNGFLLVGIVVFLVFKAVERLRTPLPDLDSLTVLAVAVIALAVNILVAVLLRRDARENINAKGALWNVLGDALASIGVIVAAALVHFTGNVLWDTLVTFFVCAIILVGAWGLLRATLHVLMEATPAHIDLAQLKRVMEGVEGVVNVHDLHVWTLTPGRYSASMHATIERSRILDFHHVVHDMEGVLMERFGLSHCTIQVEPAGEDHVSDRYDPVSQTLD
jgi:cobalt-zinc-cadmium efflux system protein